MQLPSAEFALPSLDVRELGRRALIPAAVAAVVAGALIVAGGPMQAFASALRRAVEADPRWVAAAAAFEVLSFAGYIALLWLVAGRATPRMGPRESVQVTLGGAAATRLLPTAGVGGAALTLWSLRRTGMGSRAAGRTLLTFLVLLYAVFLGAIAISGGLLRAPRLRADDARGAAARPRRRSRSRWRSGSACARRRTAPRACAPPGGCSARRSGRAAAAALARPPPARRASRGGRSTPPCWARCSTRSAARRRCWCSSSRTSSARPATPSRSRAP